MTGPAFWRDLYGPGYDPKGRYPMSGDDCLAVKRVLSRMGYLPWTEFTNTYGQGAEDAAAEFQRAVGIQPTGHWGKPTHDASRKGKRVGGTPNEPAWDAYSTELYNQAINTPHPTHPFKRDLWGPAYDPNNRYPMSGDDVVGVKRTLSRAGFLPWETATDTNVYGKATESACSAFQRTVAIQATGHYGGPTHSALLRTMAAGQA